MFEYRPALGAKRGRITAPNETIISFRWSAIFVRSSKGLFSESMSLRKDSPMPNKNEREARNSADSTLTELAMAHYVGAAILLAAADGFLLLVFSLNRVVDFSRYAY